MIDHPPNLDKSLDRFQGQEPTVLGNINVDLDEAQNPRSHIVANLLT